MSTDWEDLAKERNCEFLETVNTVLSDSLFTTKILDSLIINKDEGISECVRSFLTEDILNDIAECIMISNNECSVCHGSGGIPEYPCYRCYGEGTV